MKSFHIGITIVSLLLIVSACDYKKDGNQVIDHEPGSSTTIIDDKGNELADPGVSVDRIDKYENMEISAWLDEETVIVSKENDSLDKMALLELSEFYPRSLYRYNMNTKEYKLIKAKKDLFLGGATLSQDKKHLLYHETSQGDPGFFVMNLDTLGDFGIRGEPTGAAVTASWEGNEVLGTTYNNQVYTASPTGEISVLEDIKEESLFIIRKINDYLYYNTSFDETLTMLDLSSKEKKKLDLGAVYDVIPSPDESMMLVLQNNGTKFSIKLCEIDGSNQKIIAEGTEIGGVSWSPDQRMIAYTMKDNSMVNGLNIHDMLTGESYQIAVNIQNSVTNWSPSGDKLVYSEWNGEQYTSSVVYLSFSMQK